MTVFENMTPDELVNLGCVEYTCNKHVGTRPWWMNQDQWEAVACLCRLLRNHDGPCDCKEDHA